MFTDRALLDLLNVVWRTGGDLPAVLDHLARPCRAPHPPDPRPRPRLRLRRGCPRHARALLQAAVALPAPERTAQTEQLLLSWSKPER
ncbi:hypothetical protein [Streptomyces exfoliatus]|uniref:hypothetical protein n=1 Tax=Streptomyces exfoliatus TaxID=1905 RepID=UPI003C30452F